MEINEWNMIHQTTLFQLQESRIYALYARILSNGLRYLQFLKGSRALNGIDIKLHGCVGSIQTQSLK